MVICSLLPHEMVVGSAEDPLVVCNAWKGIILSILKVWFVVSSKRR